LAGAFDAPLSAGGYATVALGLIAAGQLVRGLPLAKRRTELAIAASVLVIAGAFAVALPQSPAFALLCLWLPIAVVEGWAWRGSWGTGAESLRPADAVTVQQLETPPEAMEQPATATSPVELSAAMESDVTQSFERRTGRDGSETIAGYARARFEPGERTVYLHVPFCPPLATVPEFAAESVDGPSARVRAVQVLPQGARLEVRLEEVSGERQEVSVEFSTCGRETVE
jgi:hypothetical protein